MNLRIAFWRFIIGVNLVAGVAGTAVTASAQPVTLSRMERAAGPGYVPYTDANGKQTYQLLDTLVGGLEGSGTDGHIAVWGDDTLNSRSWEVTNVWIRGTLSNEPEITSDGWYRFRGRDSTGVKWGGLQSVGIHSKSLTPKIFVDSTWTWIQPTTLIDTRIWFLSTGFGRTSPGGAFVYNSANPSFSYASDGDTGMGRIAADRLGLYAGTTTNPQIRLEGVGDSVVVDGNKNGTADLIVKNGAVRIPGTLEIGTYVTSPGPDQILTRNGNNVGRVTLGSGLSFSGDTLNATITANLPRWDGGRVYIGTTRFVLSTTPDTMNFNNSSGTASGLDTHLSSEITFDTVPGSNYRGWIFDKQGHYEFCYQFNAKGSSPATNKRAVFSWHVNGVPVEPTTLAGDRVHYIEESTFNNEAACFHVNVAAGQYIQLVASVNSGTSDYDARGFHVQIKKIAD